ncbi:serine/arginine repetitive matrix protein 1 isoform X2 [Amyelois transitella]|uniref:serine/arginine repetitive matrix protein 1 isoform X2 n=1 Tax=Amyelois transitella TaxID=680683 RepID=UPI002990494B|nr:serine/arginine repetitive matrix protein 1 isoform X2 [Amyelois transitella]
MSGGSQHNPNGRQSQMGPSWSPLQLQMANLLARAPQAHMASERGVTWHTPTPPPHLYHVPAPSPPDPLQGLLQLQAMKNAGNSVFRHTATPPELYRHTPTPPDKHHMRHTPSPGDVKAGSALPPADLYAHLGPGREKLRPEELLSYARVGVDLSLGSRAAPAPSNGSAAPSLSVRDAPTINSLIARAQPRAPHARVDALLERLVPSPVSPHSVIVHSRAAPTPSPPSSNEDSADSCGAMPGSKRKRKPERTVRLPAARALPAAPPPAPPAPAAPPTQPPAPAAPLENGDAHARLNGPPPAPALPEEEVQPLQLEKPEPPQEKPPQPQQPPPPTRRKSRSGSAETIDDIAAMIASTTAQPPEPAAPPAPHNPHTPDTPHTIDTLKNVLASPEAKKQEEEVKKDDVPQTPQIETAAAPRRRSARTSNAESTNVPIESPSEAKPAEPDTSEPRSSEPTAASFVEVEKQLENMFAGLEENEGEKKQTGKARKRRKSAPTKGERKDRKAARRSSRASEGDDAPRKKMARKRADGNKGRKTKETPLKDAYDSGSNASSGRSRGPYIQIRGPRDSPLSVSVINASTGEDEVESTVTRRKPGEEFRNGLRARGLHASTLGLRYDATTPDATWLCVFCERGPHAAGLGDLFGPYTVETDCEEYRALDEATRRRYGGSAEVWLHEACGVWAPGLVAGGARVWGLAAAVWAARGARCAACCRTGAAVSCARRGCRLRCHVPCARSLRWTLDMETFRALCDTHT